MQPDHVLAFEPPQAQALEWLPLAVRFKLDACCLKLRLADWQALPLPQRRALLSCPAGAAFEALVLACVPQPRRLQRMPGEPASFAGYLARKQDAAVGA